MAYKKITIKGKGKEQHSFVGIYVGKFERIGQNKLSKVDELRTSKGSQLRRSFQVWHTERNQYILKILNNFSQWQILTLNSVGEIIKWLGSNEMYDDLARYAALIHDLEAYALPRIENLNKFKKPKVRSENWRKPLEKSKPISIADDIHIGEYDYFSEKRKMDENIIDKGDVAFFGMDDEMVDKFALAAKNNYEEKQRILRTINNQKKKT